ncbi:hypothetical protein ACS0Y6_29940, partial [Burkholderia gladioli]
PFAGNSTSDPAYWPGVLPLHIRPPFSAFGCTFQKCNFLDGVLLSASEDNVLLRPIATDRSVLKRTAARLEASGRAASSDWCNANAWRAFAVQLDTTVA